jgi:hypothetical protein
MRGGGEGEETPPSFYFIYAGLAFGQTEMKDASIRVTWFGHPI